MLLFIEREVIMYYTKTSDGIRTKKLPHDSLKGAIEFGKYYSGIVEIYLGMELLMRKEVGEEKYQHLKKVSYV